MSVRTMAKVWEGSKHASTPLLMLLAIADFADDDGKAYPAVGTLAKKCRASSRQAIRILAELEASGELQVLKNKGPKGTNLYRVALERLTCVSPLTHTSPLTSEVDGGDIQGQKPLTPVSPEPSLNHQEPPRGAKRSSAGQSFKTWYETTKATNPDLFANDDPVFEYIEKVGLNHDFFLVAWHWFKRKHLDSDKRQKDWPKTFLNYVRNNYGRLWYLDKDQNWRLTSTGKQVAIEYELDPEMVAGKRADPFASCI